MKLQNRLINLTCGKSSSIFRNRILKTVIPSLLLFCFSLFGAPTLLAQSAPTAADFQRTVVADVLDLPMEFEISQDGRVFVVNKCGGLYAWDLDSGTPLQTATISNVRCVWEDGLLSLALDPNFTQNNFIYFQYTAPGSKTRVSRFTVDANNGLVANSESILLEWTTGNEATGHMGGSLQFDLDGNLLITTGDNMPASGYFAPGAQGTSGNTNDFRGKILRIKPTAAGGYTIPAGNLFTGDPLRRPEIYGMGFRNPFRLNIDPLTGFLYVGDIGPDSSAASAEGPGGIDEIHELREAGNYGWPYIIGFNQPYAGFNPDNLVNNYSTNTGATNLPPAKPAIWTIRHQATMAGPVYRFNESIENDFKLPAFYDGKLIFWDFNSSRFFTLNLASGETPLVAVDMPLNTQNFQGAIDVELDPRTHQLYVLQWGSGCCDKEPYGGGMLYRFDYIGDRDNGVNLALGATATATSVVGGHVAGNVLDGDPTTRWESNATDPQALTIELDEASTLGTIVLTWEAAFSSRYTIEASVDGVQWFTVVEENNGVGGTKLHIIDSPTAYRFVRLTGIARGTGYGHSLFEVEIYGGEGDEPPEPLTEFAYLNMPHTLDTQFTGVPLLLSQTGVFSDTPNMVPSENLLPFAPNSQLWSDRAAKQRWISIPAEKKIDWHATDNWTYPQGTVAVKHFELPLNANNPAQTKRLETRLIVVKADGNIYGVTYKWRADNSDADMLTDSLLENISITHSDGTSGTQTWAYPSPTECTDCHNADSSKILGLSTRQLNGNFNYPGQGTQNQLVFWNNLELFSPAFSSAQVGSFDKMVAIGDNSATLEQRIKSYIDTNCAHCHGTGQSGSQWDGRFNTPLDQMQIVNHRTTGIRNYFNEYGIADANIIAAGAPEESIFYIRDKSVDPNDRMPPIGRLMEHEEYLQVLEQWIYSLGNTNPGGGEETLLSQGKPTTASSVEGPFNAAQATDGNPATRWSSLAADPQWIQIDLEEVKAISKMYLHWEAAYARGYTIEGSLNGDEWSTILNVTNGTGGEVTHSNLAGNYRYIRLTGTQRATVWGYSLFEFDVYGADDIPTVPTQPVLLSLDKPVTTSSVEGGYLGTNAVDGDLATRWGSEFADPQSIEIDLESAHNIREIVLVWEAAFGSAYNIQGSLDGANWTTLVTQNNGAGGVEVFDDLSGSYRYIRLNGTTRGTPWGYSLFEFEVWGGGNTTQPPTVPTIAIASPTAGQQFQLGSSVNLQVSVSDSTWFSRGGRYRYSLNGASAVTVDNAAAINLGALPVGSYNLQVTLLNVQGQVVGLSASIAFSVNPEGDTPVTPSPAKLTPVDATASSFQGGNSAPQAIDGNLLTRWESEASDPQTIELDMGQSTYFTRAVLSWEGAYGRAYTIDVSENGSIWTTVYSTEAGNGGVDDLVLDGQQGRYIRMRGTVRGTGYGYSLFEFDVYGIAADPSLALINIVAPASGQAIVKTQPVELQIDISDSSWIASGGSYNYYLDNNSAVNVNSLSSINLGLLPTGRHTLRVTLVNSEGNEVGIPRTRVFTVSCGDDCPNVLVFSKTAGFRHDSIPAGIAMVQDLGAAYGYNVTVSEDSTLFTTANLAQYTTIVFNNTTGDIFNESQKAAFRSYMEGGGGFVGFHSAADTEHGWDWYTDTLFAGAEFIHHGDGIPRARVEIEQVNNPIVNHIGSEWYLNDEWYFWRSNPRGVGNVEVLANLDRSSYASNYPVEDHPIVFTNNVGAGRMFYSAIGHVSENFSNPIMVEKVRKAIEWTSGD